MRLCLACDRADVADDWRCRHCGWMPHSASGFRIFAPELADQNDGFEATAHEDLQKLQDRSFWFRARNRLIRDLVGAFFGEARRVLEVGCGTGFVLLALQEALPMAEVNGSEIHSTGLPYARERLRGAGEVCQMDARLIPFENHFDLICAFDVLEHIDEDTRVLERMTRALKPGGGMLLSVPQHPGLWSRNDDLAHHKRRYTRGELQAKCKAAGLDVIFSSSFVTSLLPLMALQRMTRAQDATYDPKVEMQLPGIIDRLFELMLDAERGLIGLGLRLPAGGSRFVAARKPA